MVGEVSSSSMVAREDLEILDPSLVVVDVGGGFVGGGFVCGAFFFFAYGLTIVLRRRQGGAAPFKEEGSFSLFLW